MDFKVYDFPLQDGKKKLKDLQIGTGQISALTRVPSSELPTFGKKKARSSSSRFLDQGQVKPILERLPSLTSVTEEEVSELFVKKIRQCRVVFDFTKPLSDVDQKDIKQDVLLELVDFVANKSGIFTPLIYKEISEMISINLFRPLPPRLNPLGAQFDPEEDEPILEDAWPHIQIVYELFLKFLEAPDFNPTYAKHYFSKSFVSNLIYLFGCEDPRERDYLKMILHRIYGKFLSLRSFIRKSIKNALLEFIYEFDIPNGIYELLEILGSIINGFSIPLKEEHVNFLMDALLPLHRSKSLPLYHSQLSFCIIQYIQKDKNLTYPIIKKLFKYWPVVNSTKELLFLSELEDILSIIKESEFERCMDMVIKKYAKCIESNHFQIAEKSLLFWNHENIYYLFANHIGKIFPILFPSLYYSSRFHWHKSIRPMAWYSLKMFKDIDEKVFNDTIEFYQNKYLEEKESDFIDDNSVYIDDPIEGYEENNNNNNNNGQVENKRLRRKSLLPIDKFTIDAMVEYINERQESIRKEEAEIDYNYYDSSYDSLSESYSSDTSSDSL